ncbi:MAG: 3'(2'),5'-bisphosphate nucleotidase [Planctomyces sp.]|jgi:3'(2'), 5'-bisphosphate nucleotidase
MNHGFRRELEAGLQAVRQAALLCRQVQSGITTESLAKRDNSPVTVADYGSQAVICRLLAAEFPQDPVIGEEGAAELRTSEGAAFLQQVLNLCAQHGAPGTPDDVCGWVDHGGASQYSARFWTLDPIDGTKGFLRKEQYAISLALIVNGQIELGILGCPNMEFPGGGPGVLAWAVRGYGAWQQPLFDGSLPAVAVRTSVTSEPAELVLCESVESGHSAHDWSGLTAGELAVRKTPLRMDSQCKYLAVARGEADVYLRLPTKKGYQEKIWDHAGGVLLVLEAGGQVTDISGRLLDFRQGSTLALNEGVVATNGRVHPVVLRAIERNRPPG